MITKCSVVKTGNLIVNAKPGPLKSNSEQQQFLLKAHFHQKSITKFFKIKKVFWGHFCLKGIFPENSC